jgi:acetylornithine deacetylase
MTPQTAADLLRPLVEIPSVNPALSDDDTLRGEARLVDWLEPWFAQQGFRTRRIEATPGRPNLLAAFGAENPARTVLFESHLDTVGVSGFHGDPFALREENGRLYGRGACDTKGPLAAFMAALDADTLAAIRASGVQLLWLGAIGEETGNLGAEEAVAAGIRADACVVLEPTGLRIVHAHKGACWFKVATRGRAAHGSDPARGDNAILKIPAVWHAIEAATAAALRIPSWARPLCRSAPFTAAPAPTSCPTIAKSRWTAAFCPAKAARASWTTCAGGWRTFPAASRSRC